MDHRLEAMQQAINLADPAEPPSGRVLAAADLLDAFGVRVDDKLHVEKSKRIPGPGRWVVIAVRA